MGNRTCLRECMNCGKRGIYATTACRSKKNGISIYCGYLRVVRNERTP